MRTRHYITLLALVTLLTTVGAAAGDLKIVTKDENTEAIEGINVTIRGTDTDVARSRNTTASGEALFTDLEADDYIVNMSDRLYLSREVTVSVEDATQTEKTIVLERRQLEGKLRVHVKDFRGDDLGGADVRVAAQDQDISREQETPSDGIVSFTLPIGTYDVYVNHPAHQASHVPVDVRQGKTVEKNIQLVESGGETTKDNLEISQIIVPSRIKKGSDVDVSFKVRNMGDDRMQSIEASITAFGQTATTDNFAMESGTSRWMVLNVSVPMDASGPEEIQVEVENNEDRDVEFITTTVSDLRAYMDLTPQTVKNGQPTLVKGRVIHTDMVEGAADLSANLYIGGSFVTSVTTDKTGRFSTYVYPEAPGSYTVTLRNSFFSVSQRLQVEPALEILALNAPSRVNRTAVHDICAQAEASNRLNTNAVLTVDGTTTSSRNINIDGTRTICFTLPTATKGEHTATFTLSTGTYDLSREHTYTVQKQQDQAVRMETPRSIDVITGKHGIVGVNLTNTRNTSRNVTVRIDGLDRQYEQTIRLQPRTRTAVSFNISTGSTGTYTPSIIVESGNETLATASMSLEAHTERQSLTERAARQVNRVTDRLSFLNVNYLIGAVILAALVLILSRINATPESLEPRQR